MSGQRQGVGRRGEALAAAYLRERGYEIVAENVRTPFGELDLVCRCEGTLVAVEVKTRRSAAYGLPEEAVTPAKLAHIAAALEHYLQVQDLSATADRRIDVVAVELGPTGQPLAIRLLQGAGLP
jgi:putative endonuclease